MTNTRGNEYNDYNMVFTLPNSDPIEPHLCEKWFKLWQNDSELNFPEIVFHEICHSSTTYKLELSSRDVKSVQNDTGHASAKMVVDVYSHRNQPAIRKLAQTVQEDFYSEQMENNREDESVRSSIEKLSEAKRKKAEEILSNDNLVSNDT